MDGCGGCSQRRWGGEMNAGLAFDGRRRGSVNRAGKIGGRGTAALRAGYPFRCYRFPHKKKNWGSVQ